MKRVDNLCQTVLRLKEYKLRPLEGAAKTAAWILSTRVEWISHQAQSLDLPIPVITKGGKVETAVPYAYCLQKFIPQKTPVGDNAVLWQQVGQTMRQLSTIPTNSHVAKKFNSPYINIHHPISIQTSLLRIKDYFTRIETSFLTSRNLEAALNILESYKIDFNNLQICHNDLKNSNLLINAAEDLVSIVDWDEAQFLEAPYSDLAQLDFWWQDRPYFNAFATGYGIELTSQTWDKIRYYQVFRFLHDAILQRHSENNERCSLIQQRINTILSQI